MLPSSELSVQRSAGFDHLSLLSPRLGLAKKIARVIPGRLGEDADAWWYYLESEGKPALIDPENPDPKVAEALHMSEGELRQILDFHLRETREEQVRTAESASKAKKPYAFRYRNQNKHCYRNCVNAAHETGPAEEWPAIGVLISLTKDLKKPRSRHSQ